MIMRTIFLTTLICSFSGLAAQQAPPIFAKFDAMIGTWKMDTKKGTIYETWSRKDDSSFQNRSIMVTGKDTTVLENISLLRRGENIFFIPTIPNQNKARPVSFRLEKFEKGSFVFTNPEHDFPQTIIYELPQNDTLFAKIEGKTKGNFIKSEYIFTRVK